MTRTTEIIIDRGRPDRPHAEAIHYIIKLGMSTMRWHLGDPPLIDESPPPMTIEERPSPAA